MALCAVRSVIVARVVTTAANKSRLRKRLRAYVDATILALEQELEWPRPFSAPLRLRELHLPRDYDQGTRRDLSDFLHESGVGERLRTTGHTWLWHYEPFAELFVQQYAARAIGHPEHDSKVFDRLFERAWAEIERGWVRLRQVLSVSGMPFPREGTRALPGFRARPYGLNTFGREIWSLLWIEYQRDRVSVWTHGAGTLIAHDLVFRKHRDETAFAYDILQSLEERSRQLVMALRLLFGGRVTIESVHTAQLSRFPLYPLMESPGRDRDVHSVTGRYMTRSEWARLRSLLAAVSGPVLASSGVSTLVPKFLDAYRWKDNRQNVIDLAICFESLFDVSEPELSYKLAARGATLLGGTDEARTAVANALKCLYDVRSELVHGKGARRTSPERRIVDTIHKALGTPHDARDFEDELRPLVQVTREFARRAIAARLMNAPAWPSSKDWNDLVLHHGAARQRRKELRI